MLQLSRDGSGSSIAIYDKWEIYHRWKTVRGRMDSDFDRGSGGRAFGFLTLSVPGVALVMWLISVACGLFG
ncbi:MAG: hypothetical protein ACUVXI_13650 [bacterium]